MRRRRREKICTRIEGTTQFEDTCLNNDNKYTDMLCNQKCKHCQVKEEEEGGEEVEEQNYKSIEMNIANNRLISSIKMSPFKAPLSTSLFSILLLMATTLLVISPYCNATSGSGADSAIKFNLDTNSYSGLTFTFDPRLDKRVEWLHFEHWLSIMQHSSSLLYDALNGRAHLAEVRVLIPYKWRQFSWPVLHKPGVPIITNRRLRFSDSDVIVGFEGKFFVVQFRLIYFLSSIYIKLGATIKDLFVCCGCKRDKR